MNSERNKLTEDENETLVPWFDDYGNAGLTRSGDILGGKIPLRKRSPQKQNWRRSFRQLPR